ncbi:TetR/AcrR family transcriptional regulator C-terminal domain-containing protein [Saccharopolyspora sp. NPDC002686]|uniref:TetR/AcrR family transcriptional regulator C-terminal domain-containing protein n=1 Tax=Saccharopolyspora sp. NPDC002686 TaxID=3154541 RepID=UPI0033312AE4
MSARPRCRTRVVFGVADLEIVEGVLATLHAAGFSLEVGLDVLFSLTGFVLGHVVTATSPGGELVDASEQVRNLSDVDPGEFPLLAAAAAGASSEAGAKSRFDFALDAMLAGFEQARITS